MALTAQPYMRSLTVRDDAGIGSLSPLLLSCPDAKILLFDHDGMRETAYGDTEHYAVTRDFLNHYPRRLQLLLADKQDYA